MSQQFPPRSTREQEITILVELMNTVINGRTAIYLSAALTTGRRFSEWYVRVGGSADLEAPSDQAEYQRLVVEPNRAEVRRLAEELRSKFGRVVIDPTALPDLPGWTQSDYRMLWARVIERYVEMVILADGWQYSNGCSYEFLVAHSSGARTVDWDQRPIALGQGAMLIQAAIEEMRACGIPTDFLEQIAKRLR